MADSVRGPAWQWDPSLFAGCAPFYVRGRVAYPSVLADLLVDVLDLDGRGRLLDVGCGPGSLTLLLASHFEEAVGVDADEQMLAEAERQAVAAGITNIEWMHGKGEDISPDMGHFRVASMAASFHWTLMLKSEDNPEGLPAETFDAIRDGEVADRSQLYRDLAGGPFFGHNRRGDVDQGFRDAFWLQSMACGHRAAYECIAAFSATDFRPDLSKLDVATLVIHGDDDQIVPFEVGGKRSADMVSGAELKVYEGSGHALPDTDRERLHADLLAFIDS